MTGTSEIFRNGGILSAHLDKYEERDSQSVMANAIEGAIDTGGVVLAEAGTGTGKTLAYLVPAILSGQRVVVTTGTRNLQEQIFFKDLSLLESVLDRRISAAYLKGQENYLCMRRLEMFLASPRVLSFDPNDVSRLETWSRSTITGDRMELEDLSDNSPIWRHVCSTRETRIGAKCPFNHECHVTRARANAGRAQIVVVNHHLYFADLATRMHGGSILPNHDAVVFDEAHLIEDIATEFFSIKVSSGRIDRLMDETTMAINGARLATDGYEERRPRMLDNVKSDASSLFALVRGSTNGRTHLAPEDLSQVVVSAYHRLDSSLEAALMSLRSLEGRDENIDQCASRFDGLREDLSTILDRPEAGYVHWVETRRRTAIVGASPIDISERFRDGVLFSIPCVVLTSATLSTGGDFKFLRSRLGIDFDALELSLPAPFDFEKQSHLFVPGDIPDPRDDGFVDAASALINRLIHLTGGGALILCTSLRNMKAFHERLPSSLVGPVLLQGESPKTSLISRFLEEMSSVLVATTSFWQGVDLPGQALRLVIMDKLPFASPADPVVAARITHLKETGASPFLEYQVPQAALTLKQGFGRLIRTSSDFGVVAVLDRRLNTMRYAPQFIQSLPPCPRTNDFEDLARWWEEIRESSPPETS